MGDNFDVECGGEWWCWNVVENFDVKCGGER